ncbi:MAG: hypothetical protein LBK99_17150, partial [Opitutaceae bacterium]|nr:hypothetical protein [Opitutaceae bacterium]
MKRHLSLVLLLAATHTASAAPAAPVVPVTPAAPAASAETRAPRELPVPADIVPARFSAAPPPGIHPRILISPEDLPGVRERLKNTAAGRRAWNAITSWTNICLNPSTRYDQPLRAAWDKLVAGDPAALDAITEKNKWWRGNIGLLLQLEAFTALVTQDHERGATAGAALATYAKISGGHVLAAHLAHQFDNSIGYAYDLVYPFINDGQRAEIRAQIAAATRGRESHGMSLPAAAHTYNFMPHGMGLLLLALSIEGEEGYDPTIYPRSVQVMRNFLANGIDTQGDPREDTHYFNFGMAWGAQGMVAMARRGDNLFTDEHYRRVPNWYAQAMEPFGEAFSQHQDTPNDGGGLLPNYAIMKWVWPDDPALDFVWKNRVRADYSGINYRGDFLVAALYPSDWKNSPGEIVKTSPDQWGANTGPLPPSPRDPAPKAGASLAKPAAALGLPLAWLSEKRQIHIARDKWAWDATVLHFTINHHQRGPSHTHANCLDITLSALGRKWAIDRGFGIAESKDHSVVLIDGKGQGFFPAPGRLVEQRDTGHTALITGDAKYAYDWTYEFGHRTGLDYRKNLNWQPETTHPETLAIYRERADPEYKDRPWEQRGIEKKRPGLTDYPHKAPWNVVEKAFRTALLRRGERPYVLIADDIRKDDAPHTCDWLLQVPGDLEIKRQTPGEVVLGSREPGDDRRLLVRMIDARAAPGEAGAWELETYEIVRSPETGSTRSYGKGQRLRFTLRSVEPAFRVLLYPHRDDAPLPETGLTRGGG